MKERINSLCRKITRPITENPIFFSILSLLLLLPAIIYEWRSGDWRYTICAIPSNITFAYLLCAFCSKLSNLPLLRTALCTIIGIFSFIEGFLAYSFGTLFTATLLQMVLETTPDEVSGFITTYLLTKQTGLFVLFAISGVVALYGCARCLGRKKISINNLYLSLMISVVILGALGIYAYRDVRNLYWYIKGYVTNDIHRILEIKGRAFYTANYTTIGNFGHTVYLIFGPHKEIEALKKCMQTPLVVKGSNERHDIILILGESYNKYHSSLYGYRHRTNPLLSAEHQQGNLFIFKDIVSPYNYTHRALRTILSFYSQDADLPWWNTPLFPFIYREAGYESIFLSNQEVRGKDTWTFDFLNCFLVSSDIAPLLFDRLNNEKYKQDLDLVDFGANWDSGVPQFWLYHLLGQHSSYNDRYPAEEAVFTKVDYADRADLTDSQKEVVAHYDNATRYNDKVVAAILDQFRDKEAIVVYLSDHGEEVYDYRKFAGRSHEPIVTPQRAKYQFEIPFMIWMSDSYKENHPDIAAQVERSVDRPFMIDDLPHLMLDLAGIECEWFDPTRSVINDRFNTKRKRLLLDSKQDYDEIMGNRAE